ncbi:lipocalin family protein [Nocardioides sp.]|uniref:lipocalin family protein n=1 Tax=Nocardioides sp. TaxID=35761 RepID=UPI0035173186
MSRIRTALAAATALFAVLGTAGAVEAAAPSSPAVPSNPASQPLAPVASVDLSRYLGQWEQVAAIPQLFQIQCARNSRAVYTAVDADTIGVTNTCRTWLGRTSRVTGTADVRDAATNAQLRVSFNGIPAFGDTSQPNYVITYLAPDYSWAVVGDPGRDSGFVLSRTPTLPVSWARLRAVIEDRGYDSCRFRVTPVDSGRQDRARVCTA